MSYLFTSFSGWKEYLLENEMSLPESVLQYELKEKGGEKEQILSGILNAYQVMKDAVHTGLKEDMSSRSGMINNGAKKVYNNPLSVLSPEFQKLIFFT